MTNRSLILPLLNVKQLSAQENPIAPDAWEEKVLKSYLEGDWQHYPDRAKLREIPASRRKRCVILKWLVNQFDAEIRYSEKDLSDRIQRCHPDAAMIRREWIGYQRISVNRAFTDDCPQPNGDPSGAIARRGRKTWLNLSDLISQLKDSNFPRSAP